VLRHVGETGVGGYVGSLYGHPFLGAIGLPAAEAAARTAWHASTNLAKNILERPWGTAGDVSRYLWGGMQSTSMAPQTPPGQGGLQPGWGNRLLQNWPQGL
jgi:hypothetical protein